MKNTSLIALIALMIVLAGALGFVFINRVFVSQPIVPSTTPETSQSEATIATGSTEKLIEKGQQPIQGHYVAFSPTMFNSSASTRRVLFFYANWCPTCKPADQNFTEQVTQLPDDVTLIRVNYNDNETDQAEKELAKKYGVTYQHTFVQIDSQGTEVTKWNGGQIEELLAKIK